MLYSIYLIDNLSAAKGLYTMNQKLCGLYARVSTERQSEVKDGSLDTQLDRLSNYIKFRSHSEKESWKVIDTYREEGKSGKNMDRPELQRLLNDLKCGHINTVIVTKLDRITRSLLDFYKLTSTFKEFNAEFISLEDNFDTSSPMGRAMLNITLIFAELEREQTSKRTKDKMAWRAEQGMWNGGQVLGYDLIEGELKINKEESKLVKLMFEKYLELKSLKSTADYLNEKGHRTKQYISNRRKTSRGGQKFYVTNLKQKLTSPLYIGEISYKDKTFKGKHEPVISMPLWTQVQQQLGLTSPRRRKKERVHNFILQGLTKCGNCGSFMTSKYSTGRTRLHPYYQCTKNSRYGNKECDMRYVPAEEFEKFVIEELKKMSQDKNTIDQIVKKANKDTDKLLKQLNLEKKTLENKLLPINNQINNVFEAIGNGIQKTSSINKKMLELETQKENLEREIENVGFEINKLKSKVLNAKIMQQSLKEFAQVCNAATPDELKNLIPRFVEQIIFTPSEIKIALYDYPTDKGLFKDNHPGFGAPDGSKWLPRVDSNHGQVD